MDSEDNCQFCVIGSKKKKNKTLRNNKMKKEIIKRNEMSQIKTKTIQEGFVSQA